MICPNGLNDVLHRFIQILSMMIINIVCRVGPHSPKMPRYGHSMLEDTRVEMQRL